MDRCWCSWSPGAGSGSGWTQRTPRKPPPWMPKDLPWKPERGREIPHRSSTYPYPVSLKTSLHLLRHQESPWERGTKGFLPKARALLLPFGLNPLLCLLALPVWPLPHPQPQSRGPGPPAGRAAGTTSKPTVQGDLAATTASPAGAEMEDIPGTRQTGKQQPGWSLQLRSRRRKTDLGCRSCPL